MTVSQLPLVDASEEQVSSLTQKRVEQLLKSGTEFQFSGNMEGLFFKQSEDLSRCTVSKIFFGKTMIALLTDGEIPLMFFSSGGRSERSVIYDQECSKTLIIEAGDEQGRLRCSTEEQAKCLFQLLGDWRPKE